MTIHDLIAAAYPNADLYKDYVVQDDGTGPYVVTWNIAGPIPAGVRTVAATPIQTWFALSKALCADITKLIDGTAAPERLRYILGLDDLIAAAEPGSDLAPGISLEQASALAALADWFKVSTRTPLTDPRAGGKSAVQIMSEIGGS
jgi:hypothetical protein